ncbi:MAG: two-component system, NtrC family, sensor kinase [Blastococcus sp.]|nr:two-component system, NtrC family, sensor kinase [Blastococcus sp.]
MPSPSSAAVTSQPLEDAALTDLAAVLDTSGEAFIRLTPDWTICGWNTAAEKLLGWTAEEIIGRSILDTIVAGRRRELSRRRLETMTTSDSPRYLGEPVELIAVHRDGREIWVESRLGRVWSAGQWQPHAFLRDITERREAAHSLARSEALHQVLAENSGDVISRHSPDGRFLYVSAACHQLLGFTPEELLACDPRELLHPDDADELIGSDGKVTLPKDAGEITVRARHSHGHWVWIEAMPSVLRDAAGAVEEIQVYSRNVTDRRAREAQSQQDSKLESLGRLSAGLAHEINSPIQFVGDNARFLAEAYQDLIRIVLFYRGLLDSPDPMGWEERREQMRVAEEGIEFDYLQTEIPSAVAQTLQGIERVSTIVRAMKTFSHPGHQEQVPADLNEALTATVTVTRHQVNSVADLQLDLAELPPVRCNIADLNQVFLNLIVNAADAIADTGEPGVIGVTSSLDGNHVLIAISDTGGGIPDDVRSKIFDPFFTTKDVGRGSGQGLPLVRAVVQEGHAGSLTVDTTVGSGTTFTIRLPIEGKS